MIGFGTYFKTECKRMLAHKWTLLIGMIGMLVIVSGITVVLVLVSGRRTIQRFQVGLVTADDDRMSRSLFELVSSSPDFQDILEVKPMSLNEGETALQKKELEALFVVPDGYVDSLIGGSNKPVEIRYPTDYVGMTELLLRQLTDAASRYILDTEAGIYAVKDWYKNTGSRMPVELENELNRVYLQDLLNRRDYIATETVETRDGVSIREYYFSVGLILLLLLPGLCCYPMAGRRYPALSDRIHRYGLSYIRQSFGRVLSFGIIYMTINLVGVMMALIPAILFWEIPVGIFAALLPIEVVAVTGIMFVYSVVKNASGAILSLLIGILTMGYLSGFFYPLAYLPPVFGAVSTVLPTRVMLETVTASIRGDGLGFPILVCLLYSMILMALTVLVDVWSSRRNRGAVVV